MRKIQRNKRGEFTSLAVRFRNFVIKWSIILLAVAIPSVVAYHTFHGWLVTNFVQAQAEVNYQAPKADNRNIQERLWDDLDEYDFSLKEKINTMLLIGSCENKNWNTDDRHINANAKSVDRGLFMINDVYHKEVSNACAYDYDCALKEFVRIYRERGWKEWTCGKLLNLK